MTANRAVFVAVSVLILSRLVGAQDQLPLTFAGVTIIDTVGGAVQPNRSVTIIAGTITSISAGDTVPTDSQTVDARGKYLIPGLWDMHAHHQVSGEESLPLYVATGVTGTRDMGGDLGVCAAETHEAGRAY
jgi:imidazolonepropionase-like amidohydrolase